MTQSNSSSASHHRHKNPRDRAAFTRIEVCAALGAVLMLTAVIAPTLASTRSDNERVVCFNNLRMIGRAVNAFAADHGGKVPWRERVVDGGTMQAPKLALAWSEFAWLSNNLCTARILACPADGGVRVARDFSTQAGTGYCNSSMRANATSYTVALDPSPNNPKAWISGDRNLKSASLSACSSGVTAADTIWSPVANATAWTNAVHGTQGHLLFFDGSVAFTDTPTMFRAITQNDENGSTHFLRAR